MTPPRLLLLVLSVITAVVLQTSVVYLLPLPLGEPQFVVVVVLAIGLAQGPVVGACCGFGAGLLSDLDGVHAVGRLALVLTVAGLLAGLARDRGESALGEIGVGFVLGVVALLSAGVAVADAGVGVLIGEGTVGIRQLVRVLISSAAYDAVITPIVFPPLRAALLRLDPTRNTV